MKIEATHPFPNGTVSRNRARNTVPRIGCFSPRHSSRLNLQTLDFHSFLLYLHSTENYYQYFSQRFSHFLLEPPDLTDV